MWKKCQSVADVLLLLLFPCLCDETHEVVADDGIDGHQVHSDTLVVVVVPGCICLFLLFDVENQRLEEVELDAEQSLNGQAGTMCSVSVADVPCDDSTDDQEQDAGGCDGATAMVRRDEGLLDSVPGCDEHHEVVDDVSGPDGVGDPLDEVFHVWAVDQDVSADDRADDGGEVVGGLVSRCIHFCDQRCENVVRWYPLLDRVMWS